MNLFNRIVIVVLLLVAMILCPLALLLPQQAEFVLRYGADVIQWNLDWLKDLAPTSQIAVRLIMAVAGMVVFTIGLLFLVLEIVRLGRGTVKLRDEGGELMVDSVAGHLAYHIDLLSDVLRVRPKVVSKGKAVRTALYVETAPGISVPEKSAEIRQKARQVIEEQMGLQIDGEIRVVIKPVAYPKARGRVRPPVVAEADLIPEAPTQPRPVGPTQWAAEPVAPITRPHAVGSAEEEMTVAQPHAVGSAPVVPGPMETPIESQPAPAEPSATESLSAGSSFAEDSFRIKLPTQSTEQDFTPPIEAADATQAADITEAPEEGPLRSPRSGAAEEGDQARDGGGDEFDTIDAKKP